MLICTDCGEKLICVSDGGTAPNGAGSIKAWGWKIICGEQFFCGSPDVTGLCDTKQEAWRYAAEECEHETEA